MASRFAAVAAIVCLGTATPPVYAADWQTHRYENDGFEVDFSGDVIVRPTELDAGTKTKFVRSTMYMQDGGTFAYVAAASLLVDGIDLDLDAGVKGTFDAYKCNVTDSDTKPSFPAGRAREVRASQCLDGTMRAVGMFYATGQWFYQVVYLIPGNADATEAEHFLKSFKLLSK